MVFLAAARSGQAGEPLNVLFIISDDLTDTALSCYGNRVCLTPNIDRLASRGTRFTRAYCQGTYCGPSRASFMSGYYPHATGVLGYVSPRKAIGDRVMWAEHFKNNGYHTARVSKIFHMGVPGGIEKGTDGADDPRCWTERYNSQGPEWKAKGKGETLEGNPDGKKPVVGGNTFVVVEADGDDLVHSDGRTARKACQLIGQLKDRPFFLGVGFVRPHVPFVAPRPYFQPFPFEQMVLPEKLKGDWDDIPRAGINYKTSRNMKMNVTRQKKAVSGYYASVAYMDRQVGKVMKALEESGVADRTIVIFTSDHGFSLMEHNRWSKHNLFNVENRVPLMIRVPGLTQKARSNSFVELIDLYPTIAELVGLEAPERVEGTSLVQNLKDPSLISKSVGHARIWNGDMVVSPNYLYAEWRGEEGGNVYDNMLYDLKADSLEMNNIADQPKYRKLVDSLSQQIKFKTVQ